MNLLIDKFDSKNLINKDDVLKIISTYVDGNDLDYLLKNVHFYSDTSDEIISLDNSCLGYYNATKKYIILNDDKIKKMAYQFYYRLKKIWNINDYYQTYFINFYCLYTIYHELTHVLQRLKYYDSFHNNSFFRYLYEFDSQLQKANQLFYNKNHDLFPMEIDANNNVLLKAYDIMNNTSLPKREKQILYLNYLSSLLLYYKKVNRKSVISPIEILNNQIKIIDLSLFKNEKLSKIDRLNYGLFISPHEFNDINKEKMHIIFKYKYK